MKIHMYVIIDGRTYLGRGSIGWGKSGTFTEKLVEKVKFIQSEPRIRVGSRHTFMNHEHIELNGSEGIKSYPSRPVEFVPYRRWISCCYCSREKEESSKGRRTCVQLEFLLL